MVWVVASVLLAGCAGSGESYGVNQGQMASLFSPPKQQLDYHPDSLKHLSFVEHEGKVKFVHTESYRDLMLAWSAGEGQRLRAAPRSSQSLTGTKAGPSTRRVGSRNSFQNYALLWSRELSLISLIPGAGVEELDRETAYQLISEREAEYDSLLQIDVFVFDPIGASSHALTLLGAHQTKDQRLDGGGDRVYLKDGVGNVYRPARIEVFPFAEANYSGRRAYYRRNAIFFDRGTETGDPLDNGSLHLYIGSGSRFATWVFPAAASDATLSSVKKPSRQ